MKLSEYEQFITTTAPKGAFIPDQVSIQDWQDVEPYFNQLANENPVSKTELWEWIKKRSELNAWLEEDMAWRYIRMTCDTSDAKAVAAYTLFIEKIEPEVSLWQNTLDQKTASHPEFNVLDFKGADIFRKAIRKEIDLFREENIPLQTEIQTRTQLYSATIGAMNIEWEGTEITLPQASVLLQSTDRERRRQVYEKIQIRRFDDGEKLQLLFSELVELRQKVAHNAGFANFRDYMFAALGRYDYTPQDCKDFHLAIQKAVVPLVNRQMEERKKQLGLPILQPFDLAVQENNLPPLQAFTNGADLLQRGKLVFGRLDPFLGQCLTAMEAKGHFDLESRKGKAPGGYNYPLDQTGFPFIFMNATGTLRDMVTLMHEGGHAVHSIVTRFLPLSAQKHTSSEVAELASMSMELISMDHWDVFFTDPADLKRAKKEHLAQVIDTLPWVATVDAYQHWIYENEGHSEADRTKAWLQISGQYSSDVVDFTGYEAFRAIGWQKQLHIFEVPFYYIEYGMAQLGAIAVWRNYRKDPETALQKYLQALALGNTASIREVYAAAGIRFDFSESYIQELMAFVATEMEHIS